MLDLKTIRDNPDFVISRLSTRNKDYSQDVSLLLELDEKRREFLQLTEQLKATQNAASKKIPAMKKAGEDVSAIMQEMKAASDELKELEPKLSNFQVQIDAILHSIPNLPYSDVPEGADANDNVEYRKWGSPPDFDFEPKPHWEIGANLGILDPTTAAKVTGARFHFYKGAGALLERAIINFYLDTHSTRGYTEIFPPFLVNRASMTGTGQLPKFEEDAFRISNDDLFLIPTAEVPITNMHRDEILDSASLPIKYCAYSACFRAEAGAAGRDTRGLIRQHQFNKVELVKFTTAETSYQELESLTTDACFVLEQLGLPHRVVRLCSGDMGFCSAMTYDIEVWMPSYSRYVEISSCSNFESFQARRAAIRCRADTGDKPAFVHTLNGSGVAIGRTVACILEIFQTRDGKVIVPEALRPYMRGLSVIE